MPVRTAFDFILESFSSVITHTHAQIFFHTFRRRNIGQHTDKGESVHVELREKEEVDNGVSNARRWPYVWSV